MPSPRDVLRSSIGKKLLNGLTGLLLCGFVAAHLTGNLLLLVGAEAFNEYAHFVHSLGHGYLIYVMEIGLVVLFGVHGLAGVQVALDRRRARRDGYAKRGNAGGPSRKSLASRSMIVTGTILLVFVVLHVWMFRFGPSVDEGYATIIDGERVGDLYRLVVEWFQLPTVVVAYVLVMILLGLHLRHGFWSAFQSLGATSPKYMPVITVAGVVFAAAIAVGFLVLPIYIYLAVDPSAIGAAGSAGVP